MKHILIVEPDVDVATTLAEFLKQQKYSVTVVGTARGAVQASDKKTPDTVILELALGKHGGIEFLHEFRSYPEWQAVPVVAFTMQYINDPVMLEHIGIAEYLYKPKTSLAQLATVLSRLSA